MKRDRLVYLCLGVIVTMLGLGSRQWGDLLPEHIALYAGDTLWALLIFLGIGILWPTGSTLGVATLALLFSIGIEISQLYHAPWIDNLRQTRLGGLILGYEFIWTDLVCYTLGVSQGVLGEWIWKQQSEIETDAI